MPRAYRSMRSEGDPPRPVVGDAATKLGVRPVDLSPDSEGNALPGQGGVSIFSSIAGIGRRVASTFPPGMVPARLHDSRKVIGATGSNALRVFKLGEGDYEEGAIAEGLKLIPDGPSDPDHGTIQPDRAMPMGEFRQAVVNTKPLWEDGENDP